VLIYHRSKTKCLDALQRCENNALVLNTVARYFCSERKISKARSWFTRTVKLDPDFGDAWAYYYKFEVQFGTEVQQDQVIKHCLNAEPRHGELWQAVSKDPKNWRLNTQQTLMTVVAQLPNF
jgi:pre-mRNA-processing factor 6